MNDEEERQYLEVEGEGPPRERRHPRAVVPPRRELLPEIAAVPQAELEEACKALMEKAIQARRSRARGEELYWLVWSKVLGTRRFDPAKGTLTKWLGVVAESEGANLSIAEARGRVRDKKSHERFHDDLPTNAASAEERVIAAEEAEERRRRAARQIERLRALAADNALVLRVLDEMAKGNHKPSEIAAALEVPVKKVYGAMESLRGYQAKLVESDAKPSEDEVEKT